MIWLENNPAHFGFLITKYTQLKTINIMQNSTLSTSKPDKIN